jgi:signal transduction histidine kinase
VVVGADGLVRRSNEVADRILGAAPGEMTGREWRVLTSDSAGARSPRFAEEGVLKGVRGKAVEVLMSVIPANLGGEDVIYIEAFLDLTERKLLEYRLRQSQKLEAIGQLAAGIAHEINTPTQYVAENTRFIQSALRSIREVHDVQATLLHAAKAGVIPPGLVERVENAAEAVDLEFLFSEIPTCVDQTLEGVQQISQIVRAMKEFSHPGNKDKKPCDLNHAIEDVVKQSGGGRGRITVSTRHDGEMVEVRVADTGTGIPAEHRAHVFEPFFTTKDVGKGTGQGLSVVYGTIVKTHGGTVTFQTEAGKGTAFILRLPIAACAESPVERRLEAA